MKPQLRLVPTDRSNNKEMVKTYKGEIEQHKDRLGMIEDLESQIKHLKESKQAHFCFCVIGYDGRQAVVMRNSGELLSYPAMIGAIEDEKTNLINGHNED